jgi:hypothetical protein
MSGQNYRVRGLGMDRELEIKTDQKYSLEDENELVEWIVSVIMYGQGVEDFADCKITLPECQGKLAFQQWLKDGQILGEVINVLQPGSCRTKKTSQIKLEAMKRIKEMDNIQLFLYAAEKYGVDKVDLFQTIDLYEMRDLAQVQVMLYKLGSVAQKNHFPGPVIGIKVADKNVRKFDEEIIKEGQSVIGLQMGTNQVASQQGMTPYGLSRQMVPSIQGLHKS